MTNSTATVKTNFVISFYITDRRINCLKAATLEFKDSIIIKLYR